MDEEHQEKLPAPPRFRYKLLKIVTLTVLFLTLFFIFGYSGLEATSSSKFCSSCHEMKPEYYTWKASTHSEVDCVNCHTDPVLKELAKDKSEGAIDRLKRQQELNAADTNSAAPIHIIKEVQSSACEKCHNMSTREVTPSGDLIIPHEKHMKNEVGCTQCHSGVAHGKIADRKMTFSTDYDKWDEGLGSSVMEDVTFTRPDMDTCMECHKARNVSTACKTCHKTGMIPKSHKDPNFKKQSHGALAKEDLRKCNFCHSYMSKDKIDDLEEPSSVDKVLDNNSSIKTHFDETDYAKENTFCNKCHRKRPESHTNQWNKVHGKVATKNKQQCYACHNPQATGKYETTTVSCSSCHPSIHRDFNKVGHPIPLSENQQITEKCYTCHVKSKCSACHKE